MYKDVIFYVQNNDSNECVEYAKKDLTNIKDSEIYKSLLDQCFNKKIKLFFVVFDGWLNKKSLFQFHSSELETNKRLKNSSFHVDYYNRFKTELDKVINLDSFTFNQIKSNVFEWC